jgi:hypothetical protein
MALMYYGELKKINNLDPPDDFIEPEEKALTVKAFWSNFN